MRPQGEFQPQILETNSRWIVVSKPSGMLTIPGRDSLVKNPMAQEDLKILSVWLKNKFKSVWVVHRLDRETSGVLLFARTQADHRTAAIWFQKRQVKKVYHCLASGVPLVPIMKVNRLIQGVPSVSQVEVRERYQEGFFARVTPRTGRRHQIRIHLASSGYPIWGDSYYGGVREVSFSNESLTVDRVALHASTLELPTGEKFEASFPGDFSFWLDELRNKGSRV